MKANQPPPGTLPLPGTLPPPGGVFKATVALLIEWGDQGERPGHPYDLAVAPELARQNRGRAQPPKRGLALISLGTCHLAIGNRQSGGDHLVGAVKAFTAALKEVPHRSDPTNWALVQSNLGAALLGFGHARGQHRSSGTGRRSL